MTDTALALDARPSRMSKFGKWFRSDLRGAISLTFLGILVVMSALAPWISPYSPLAQDFDATLAPMSVTHWLGADDLGRDTLSRLIYGGTASLYASFLAVFVAVLIGVPVGLLAGYLGGWVDEIVSRIIDSFLSFPAIVLAIAVTGALGIGLTNGMISVGIVFAPQLARLVRARTLVVRHELYVDSARCFGASTSRILWRHGLKNVSVNLLTVISLLFNRMLAATVVVEAVFAIPGMGNLIVNGAIHRDFPVVQGVVFAMVLIVVTLNLLTDVLYSILDPRIS
jgi:peptide/nickel transport system permease protein